MQELIIYFTFINFEIKGYICLSSMLVVFCIQTDDHSVLILRVRILTHFFQHNLDPFFQ